MFTNANMCTHAVPAGRQVWTLPAARVGPGAHRPDVGHRASDRLGVRVAPGLLGGALGRHLRPVVLDLPGRLAGVPAQRPGDELGGLRYGLKTPVRRFDGDVRAPGEHVVEMPGASWEAA